MASSIEGLEELMANCRELVSGNASGTSATLNLGGSVESRGRSSFLDTPTSFGATAGSSSSRVNLDGELGPRLEDMRRRLEVQQKYLDETEVQFKNGVRAEAEKKEELRLTLHELTRALSAAYTRICDLETNSASLEDEREAFERQKKHLDERDRFNQKRIADLVQEVEDSQRRLDDAREQARIASQRREVELREEFRVETEHRTAALRQSLETIRDDFQRKERGLEDDTTNLQNRLHSGDLERQKLEHQLAEVEEALRVKTNQFEERDASLRQERRKCTTLEESLREVEGGLKSLAMERDRLRGDLDAAARDRSRREEAWQVEKDEFRSQLLRAASNAKSGEPTQYSVGSVSEDLVNSLRAQVTDLTARVRRAERRQKIAEDFSQSEHESMVEQQRSFEIDKKRLQDVIRSLELRMEQSQESPSTSLVATGGTGTVGGSMTLPPAALPPRSPRSVRGDSPSFTSPKQSDSALEVEGLQEVSRLLSETGRNLVTALEMASSKVETSASGSPKGQDPQSSLFASLLQQLTSLQQHNTALHHLCFFSQMFRSHIMELPLHDPMRQCFHSLEARIGPPPPLPPSLATPPHGVLPLALMPPPPPPPPIAPRLSPTSAPRLSPTSRSSSPIPPALEPRTQPIATTAPASPPAAPPSPVPLSRPAQAAPPTRYQANSPPPRTASPPSIGYSAPLASAGGWGSPFGKLPGGKLPYPNAYPPAPPGQPTPNYTYGSSTPQAAGRQYGNQIARRHSTGTVDSYPRHQAGFNPGGHQQVAKIGSTPAAQLPNAAPRPATSPTAGKIGGALPPAPFGSYTSSEVATTLKSPAPAGAVGGAPGAAPSGQPQQHVSNPWFWIASSAPKGETVQIRDVTTTTTIAPASVAVGSAQPPPSLPAP